MAARPPQVAGKVKHGYVIIIVTVDGQHDVTRLVQLLNFFHPWTATDCRRSQQQHVESAIGMCIEAWPAIRDARAILSGVSGKQTSGEVCFPKGCHTRPCVLPTLMCFMSMPMLHFTLMVEKSTCCSISVRQRPIIEQTSAHSSHSFDGFHTRI